MLVAVLVEKGGANRYSTTATSPPAFINPLLHHWQWNVIYLIFHLRFYYYDYISLPLFCIVGTVLFLYFILFYLYLYRFFHFPFRFFLSFLVNFCIELHCFSWKVLVLISYYISFSSVTTKDKNNHMNSIIDLQKWYLS